MAQKKRKSKQRKRLFVTASICTVVVVAAIVICVVLLSNNFGGGTAAAVTDNTPEPYAVGTASPNPDDHQQQIDAIITRETMLEGTTIAGVDVGNMTKDEAKAALSAVQSELLASYSLLITVGDDSHTMNQENIILTVDIDSAVDEAFSLVRADLGYESVMAEVESIGRGEVNVEVNYVLDETSVRAYVANLAQESDSPAVNATVSTDQETGKIVYTDEASGTGIDQEALVQAILQAENRANVTASIVELAPSLTKTMLQEQYVLRASFTTSFKGSSSNRKYNINKGAEMMNGSILRPDEVFSCNDKLGVRTLANGWKLAGAYVQGNVDEQAGGGVCQLSSTLYNAVVLADLEIVFRQNHSMPVSYVDRGRDATINSVGNIIDFKFKNNTSGDLIILCYVSGNNVTFELYGLPLETDEYDEIRIRTERISTTEITEEITEDPTKEVGYEEITSEGSRGYVYKAYKQYYKNGTMIKEELLNNSTYKMYPLKKIVGTLATPTPSLSPSTSPSDSTPPTDEPTPTPNIPIIGDTP
ncbi:MAG: VanW family protein [Clostridia bacterium]|nr:VanW family protein [Clostridia bacterium]